MERLSSRAWTFVLIGGLVLLTCLCSAGLGAVLWFQLRPADTASVDRIAYVGTDNNIYTVDRRGGSRRALTEDAEIPTRAGGRVYRFPTWSPDNRWLAYVGVEVSPGESPLNTLYATSIPGDETKALFASRESGPFYLYWAPDARRLAFLANETENLSLRLVGLDTEPRLLDTGSPFYFTWGPDSNAIITHVGGSAGRIGRLEVDRAQPAAVLDRPATFLAPHWSPTGEAVLFAADLDEAGPALYVANERGEPQQALVRYGGAISFAWSPQADRVAYIETNQPRPNGLGQFAFGKVKIVESEGGAARTVSTREALAFFWSPDGRKIAYLQATTEDESPEIQGRLTPVSAGLQQGQFRLRWRVVDLQTGDDIGLTPFAPAPGFLSLMLFFDQYAQSLSLWSPQSDALVYSARDSADAPAVWVVDVDGATVPRRVADGDVPVWSWK